MSSNQDKISPVETYSLAVLLGIIGIIGSIGNAVVIWVYNRRRDGTTATFFIIVLAAADLLICLLVVPFTMAMELMGYYIMFDFLCKSYYVLNISNTMFSSLLISAVALDRYFCICHPMRRILPVFRAKILVCSLALLSTFLGVLSAMNVKMVPDDARHKEMLAEYHANMEAELARRGNYSMSSTQFPILSPPVLGPEDYICEEIAFVNDTSSSQVIFYHILKKLNHISFIGCILVVVFLYSLIFRTVMEVRKKTKTLLLPSGTIRSPPSIPAARPVNASIEAGTPSDRDEHSSPSKDAELHSLCIDATNDVNNSVHLHEKRTSPHKHHPDKENSQASTSRINIRDRELFQNFKSAAMLFVVAIVYILVFFPAILMANGWVDMNIVVLHLYYLNNACNPIIYCFMNSEFRRQLKRLVLRNRYYDGTLHAGGLPHHSVAKNGALGKW